MDSTRNRIFDHLLPLVPFDGWSDRSLREAGRKAGLTAQEVASAFPHGAIDAIDYFFARADETLDSVFTARALSEMRIPARIEALVMARFAHLAPHREAVRRAIAFYALPWNAAYGLQAICRTVDRIWRLAGDQSLDFNFYTKRATLAGVLSATTLFWLNDDSDDRSETLEFLKRRLANVAAFGKWKKNLTSKAKRI